MKSEPSRPALDRRAVVKRLLKGRDDLVVVAGLGSPAYDLMDAGDSPLNFYLWGAMGGASLMGLGVALAQPERPVLVLTGDGEQLMGIGGLATIGIQRPPNLSIVVLDNGHFGETGMQPSHTGLGADLVAIAAACGFAWTLDIADESAVDDLALRVRQRAGCGFARIEIAALNMPRVLPPRDGVYLKNRFREGLGMKMS